MEKKEDRKLNNNKQKKGSNKTIKRKKNQLKIK